MGTANPGKKITNRGRKSQIGAGEVTKRGKDFKLVQNILLTVPPVKFIVNSTALVFPLGYEKFSEAESVFQTKVWNLNELINLCFA